jgi:cytosine/adenosine deaminase-related metal-dependent hydrolase
MVNTHHHMFQNLTRAVPAAQNAPLFGWLQTLYPIWCNIGPDHIYWSGALAMAELAMTGCTTSSDHLYLYPNGARLEDSFAAAEDIGLRFHGTRGSMSIGESKGGLPPDRLTEAEPAILADCQRLIETHHDASRYAMRPVFAFLRQHGFDARNRHYGAQLRGRDAHASGRECRGYRL